MKQEWNPATRREGTLTVELGQEAVVYEVDRDRAMALNPLGAYLWRHASGQVEVGQLALDASNELSVPIAPEVINAAAEELAEFGLMAPPPAGPGCDLQRRQLLRTLAFATPLITSLIVPPPASAGSAGPPPPGPGPLNGIPGGDGVSLGAPLGGAAVAAAAIRPGCSEAWRTLALAPYGNRTLAECELSRFRWPLHPTVSLAATGLDRVPFLVNEEVLSLAGKSLPGLPQQMSGIPVHRKFQYLYLLHSAMGRSAHPGDSVGRYLVRYSDGDTASIPLQYGLDLVVEAGETDQRLRSHLIQGAHAPVFLSVWKNPRPDVGVGSIDFETAMSPAAPVCIAMTASWCRGREARPAAVTT